MSPLVVLADASVELRELLATALVGVGYRVATAASGSRLVALVGELVRAGEAITLVVMDVRLPLDGGLAPARALRAAGYRMPLVLITAWSDAITRASATALDASLLGKPLGVRAFRAEVDRLVRSASP